MLQRRPSLHRDAQRRPKNALKAPKDAKVFIETHKDAPSDALKMPQRHPSLHTDSQKRPKTLKGRPQFS